MWSITPHCSLIVGCVIGKIFNQRAKEYCTTVGIMKLIKRRIHKAMAIYWYRGKWQAAILVSTSKATKKREQIILDQTCTQANVLAVVLLTTAKDRRWWSHWCSLGSPDITSFFARPLKRGGGHAIITSGFNCNWLKVVIALKVMVFFAFCSLSLCCCNLQWKPACLALSL